MLCWEMVLGQDIKVGGEWMGIERVKRESGGRVEQGKGETDIVTSTSSIVILPWICFIAAPAFFIATRVSWLMFADSIE